MRFDDSLATVLAADTSTAFGAQTAWRQLVDLVGRGRARDAAAVLGRLRELREQVPPAVRAASGRALALGAPPVVLVAFFAEDALAVASPVLRGVTLGADDWLRLLPTLTPACRAVLRHRRDLPADVVRGLESFGATDFVLAHDGQVAPDLDEPLAPVAPLDETPFVAVGDAARAIPLVAEAMKQATSPGPRFEIADLVARIDAYRRDRTATPVEPPPFSVGPCDHFRFATDATGVIRWVDGVARGPLVGVSLALAGRQGAAELAVGASEAMRRRAAFRDVPLEIGGASPAAGGWRLAGAPTFDRGTGRFTGMSGVARRASKESGLSATSASDQLRQLVHELRTPANAIAGFAELIGDELIGPVPPIYRDRARLIQRQAADLLGAVEDLDTAARIEGGALELRPRDVDVADLAREAATELRPLAAERGVALLIDAEPAPAFVDDRAAQRLVTRLLATLVAAAAPGERLRVQVTAKSRSARLSVTRPRALAAVTGDALLTIDAEPEDGWPLLGTGFGLRLARNLAGELGGRLQIDEDRLTLRLPVAQAGEVERSAAQ